MISTKAKSDYVKVDEIFLGRFYYLQPTW